MNPLTAVIASLACADVAENLPVPEDILLRT